MSPVRHARVVGFTDLKKSVNDLLTPSGTISKSGRKTIRGSQAIGLVDSSSGGGTPYIAARGEPYPLSVVPSGKTADTGSLDFLEYGAPVTGVLEPGPAPRMPGPRPANPPGPPNPPPPPRGPWAKSVTATSGSTR